MFTCPGGSNEIELWKVCDGTEDCLCGADEDRCVVALNGFDGGEIKVYPNLSGQHHYICAAGWKDKNTGTICKALDFGITDASTTKGSSNTKGLVCSGYLSINKLTQQEPLVCDENEIVRITCTSTKTCGITNRRRRSVRIVGGSDANILDHPWQISLQQKHERGWEHHCGGTIVYKNWVVTAAHCVFSIKSSSWIRVVAGETSTSTTPASTYSVRKIICHPLYKNDKNSMDFALLRVASFVYSDTIKPACLPTSGQIFADNSVVTATGWGITKDRGVRSTILQSVRLKLSNTVTCRNTKYRNKILDGMICAGVKEGGKDGCQGDSGGPLTILHNSRTYLIGATSWGKGCARPGYPGVFAEISYAIDWMEREMKKNDE